MIPTKEEIHDIWMYEEGRSRGKIESGKESNFPVEFTKSILEFIKLKETNETK
jgi:hypothetical protein